MKKFIVKDIEENLYYEGGDKGWTDRIFLSETFENKDDAELFLNSEPDGYYMIIEIYIVGI